MGAALAALSDIGELLVGLVGVDERAEALELGGVGEGGSPFAAVGADQAGHLLLQLGTEAELVVDDVALEVLEAAVERLEPGRGALQSVRGADVEHQEAIDEPDQRRLVEI